MRDREHLVGKQTRLTTIHITTDPPPQAEINTPTPTPPELDHPRLFTSPYGAPWPTLLRACLSRAVTLEWRRNYPAAIVRWLIGLVLSFVAGSIFWQLPVTFSGAVSGMGMLFWVLCFILVITVPTVELTYQRRPIMLRQRAGRFYAGWMDGVPQVGLWVWAVGARVSGGWVCLKSLRHT